MSKTRRKYNANFKTKVVLDLLNGSETLSVIAGKYGVHPTQLTKWKRLFLERASEIFSEPGKGKNMAAIALKMSFIKKSVKCRLSWIG